MATAGLILFHYHHRVNFYSVSFDFLLVMLGTFSSHIYPLNDTFALFPFLLITSCDITWFVVGFGTRYEYGHMIRYFKLYVARGDMVI